MALALLDAFHFFEEGGGEGEMGSDSDSDEGGPRPISGRTAETLRRSVLPLLRDIVVAADGERDAGSVCAPAASAAVRVLKLLPRAAVGEELPRVLGSIAAVLKSRAQGIRDGARAALSSAAADLGPPYLVYLADLLRGLLTKGFQCHVLGFSLHAILAAQHASGRGVRPGEWDAALPVVAPLLAADIFGVAAEEKETAAISGKWTEAKRRALPPPLRPPPQ